MQRFGLDFRRVPSIGIEKAATDYLNSPSVTLSERNKEHELNWMRRVADGPPSKRTGLSICQIVLNALGNPTRSLIPHQYIIESLLSILLHCDGRSKCYFRRRVMLARKLWHITKRLKRKPQNRQPNPASSSHGLGDDSTLRPQPSFYQVLSATSLLQTNRLSFGTLYSKEASWKTAPCTFSFRLSELSGRACIIGATTTLSTLKPLSDLRTPLDHATNISPRSL